MLYTNGALRGKRKVGNTPDPGVAFIILRAGRIFVFLFLYGYFKAVFMQAQQSMTTRFSYQTLWCGPISRTDCRAMAG